MAAPDYWLKHPDDFDTVVGDYATPVTLGTLQFGTPSRTVSSIVLWRGVTTSAALTKDVSAQSYTTGWASFVHDTINGPSNGLPLFQLAGATLDLFQIIAVGTAGQWKSQYWNGASWTDIGSTITTAGQLLGDSVRIDVTWNIADSGGYFTIYANGAEVATFSGDTLLTADTTIDFVRILCASGNNGARLTFTSIIVDSVDTRTLHMYEIIPTSTGGVNNDTGALWFWIAEYWGQGDTSDYATFDAVGEQEDWQFADFPAEVTDSWAVESAVLGVAAKAIADPGWVLEGYITKSGVEHTDNNNIQPTAGAFAVKFIDFSIDPDTGVAWANKSALEAVTFGLTAQTPP